MLRSAGTSPETTAAATDAVTPNSKRRAIEGDGFETREARRCGERQQSNERPRERQAGGAARGRQHQTLCQELSHESRAAAAERGANRQLALACGAARKQQIRDVRAGDEQHEGDGAREHENRRANRERQVVDERPGADDDGAAAAEEELRRRRPWHAAGGSRPFGFRLFGRRAGPQSSQRGEDDRAVRLVCIGGDGGGNPEQHARVRKRQIGSRDPDDCPPLAVDLEGAADRGRIGGESIAPHPIAQHHGRRRARGVLTLDEEASSRRSHTQQSEHRRRDRGSVQA